MNDVKYFISSSKHFGYVDIMKINWFWLTGDGNETSKPADTCRKHMSTTIWVESAFWCELKHPSRITTNSAPVVEQKGLSLYLYPLFCLCPNITDSYRTALVIINGD